MIDNKSALPSDIINESDVEQKIILPLIKNEKPLGLGFSNSDFRTKPDIKKIKIDKGKKEKLYYPDYIIIKSGLPLLAIEAKKPNENLDEALKEARLYAMEINAQFPKKINPCCRLIVCNGLKTIGGFWDSDRYEFEFSYIDMNSTNPNFQKFLEFASNEIIEQECQEIQKKIRCNNRFSKPKKLLGGKSIQNEMISENSFGVNLSLDYKFLFNPEQKEERKKIIHNAYVKSKKRESHIRPIDRLIRSVVTPSKKEARLINDTQEPKEIMETLSDISKYKHQIFLLIGSVGSGKSTFVDYLREIAISEEIKKKTKWITIDLNNAPMSKDLIYNWVLNNILDEIKVEFPEYDFDELSFLEKIFSREITKLEKGPAAIYKKTSRKYKDILFEEIKRLSDDKICLLKAVIQYVFQNQEKTLIVILDNCDKANRDSQLLMFEVSNWLKSSFYCTVFLPIRETTFDQYKKMPPLDTVIKDLVFRIDPPQLEKVIGERFKYALRVIESDKSHFYYYMNNMKVECKREEVGYYLKCLRLSLFQNNLFRRLIIGLSGRNIRRGLEIFLDFCKSGYISGDEIFQIKNHKGDYYLPNQIIISTLIKGVNRYYNDDNSKIKNLFHSYPDDTIPDPYIRMSILLWLKNRYKEDGPSMNRGYHKISSLIHDLKALGHMEKRIVGETEKLMLAECIISESQKYQISDQNELICITPGGIIHLELIKDVNYLSAISEDTWFNKENISKEIYYNLVDQKKYTFPSKYVSFENSMILLNYLVDYKNYFPGSPDKFLDKKEMKDFISIGLIRDDILKRMKNDKYLNSIEKLINENPPGNEVNAKVVLVKEYGLIVEFGSNGSGLIHNSNIKKYTTSDFNKGDLVRASICDFNKFKQKFSLKLIEKL